MPYVTSSGKHFKLDGPQTKQNPLLRSKGFLIGAALLFCWLALGRQGSAIAAAEASRTAAVPASSFHVTSTEERASLVLATNRTEATANESSSRR